VCPTLPRSQVTRTRPIPRSHRAAGADTRVRLQGGAAEGEGGAEGAVEAEVEGGGAPDPLALTDAENAEKVRCQPVGSTQGTSRIIPPSFLEPLPRACRRFSIC